MSKSSDELFNDELADLFTSRLDAEGIVAATVDDGLILGVTKSKLIELLEIAEQKDDGKVIIFIKHSGAEDDPGEMKN